MNKTWEERVQAYEAEGVTRSDAQAIVDAEDEKASSPTNPSQHTPGPWEQEHQDIRKDNELLASCNTHFKNYNANAKLIAAAPELLEALKGLFEHCTMVHKYGGEGDNTREADAAIKYAKQVISKSEGR